MFDLVIVTSINIHVQCLVNIIISWEHCSPVDVVTGVRHGSVLGAILGVIYINDIPLVMLYIRYRHDTLQAIRPFIFQIVDQIGK